MSSAAESQKTGFDPVKLIHDHQKGVWRYLRALGAEPALADDITQDTFLAVIEKPFDDYNASATASYLRRVAHNLFISNRRREGKVVATDQINTLAEEWDKWAGKDAGDTSLDALRECFDQLTERAKLSLTMRFRQRASRTEIADALEITDHGAKNLMQRAKKQLRTCVEGKLK